MKFIQSICSHTQSINTFSRIKDNSRTTLTINVKNHTKLEFQLYEQVQKNLNEGLTQVEITS